MNDTTTSGPFDPTAFLGATLTEPSVRRPPIPAGVVLPGQFGEVSFRQQQGTKDTNRDKIYTFCEIPVEVDLTSNPAIRQIVGQDKVTLRHNFSVDIGPDGKGFDLSPGKNGGLRQLREALDMNKPGDQFSFMAVPGRMVLCKIGARPYKGEIFDEIDSIARMTIDR